MALFFDLRGRYAGVKMDDVSNTFDLLAAAMRAEALRHKTIAGNIANAETPGYRRVDVKFEELLAKAMDDGGGKVNVDKIEPEIYQPMNTPVKSNGRNLPGATLFSCIDDAPRDGRDTVDA